MSISTFFSSFAGMYMAQSFCHSLITAVLVDASIRAWKIEDPVVRQRFRLLIIILPILSFPLYQAINPERGSLSFRLDALFDTARWLNLEIWQGVPAGTLFLLLWSVTALVFFSHELIPVIKHALASRGTEPQGEKPAEDSVVGKALAADPGPKPEVFIIPDDDLVLFVTTGKRPTVFLSTGTVEALSQDELQAAIAHEIAHMERNKRPLLITVFLLRIVQFFNPVSLVEFRRIVQEEENICDDFAVTRTGKPQALADTLRKFHPPVDDAQAEHAKGDEPFLDRLEEFSHAHIIENRIARLEANRAPRRGGARFAFAITSAAILIINYAVV